MRNFTGFHPGWYYIVTHAGLKLPKPPKIRSRSIYDIFLFVRASIPTPSRWHDIEGPMVYYATHAKFHSARQIPNQIKFTCKHKIWQKTQIINKKLNKWKQQVQTGVLVGLKGRKTAQHKSLKKCRHKQNSNKSSSEDEIVNVKVLRHRTCRGQSLRPLNWVPNFYYN